MYIVKNLICLENNRVSVIRLMENKLEFVKKDGEIDFPITSDFWDWWKRVVSYIDGNPVDICFVYDKEYDLMDNDIIIKSNMINTKESRWKIEHIKSYFWELKPTYFNLVILDSNLKEIIINGKKSVSSRRFQTNLKLDLNSEEVEQNKNTPIIIDESEYSNFAKYFIDLIRREREM